MNHHYQRAKTAAVWSGNFHSRQNSTAIVSCYDIDERGNNTDFCTFHIPYYGAWCIVRRLMCNKWAMATHQMIKSICWHSKISEMHLQGCQLSRIRRDTHAFRQISYIKSIGGSFETLQTIYNVIMKWLHKCKYVYRLVWNLKLHASQLT